VLVMGFVAGSASRCSRRGAGPISSLIVTNQDYGAERAHPTWACPRGGRGKRCRPTGAMPNGRCTRGWAAGGQARVHRLRRIVDAILYVDQTGCAWRSLPGEYSQCRTVYGYHDPLMARALRPTAGAMTIYQTLTNNI
jgi:Putative transposase of IS4/5 family (DUF4096)